MKKFLLLLATALYSISCLSQSYIPMTSYGYRMNRLSVDSIFFVPNRDTTFSGDYKRAGALVFRTTGGDKTLYAYTGDRWINVSASLSAGLNDLVFHGDSLYAVLQNGDTVKANIPVYAPTSASGVITFSGSGKVYGDSLDVNIDLTKIPRGLTKDSALYSVIADTGILISNGNNTQFLKDISIKAKYDTAIWNAGKIMNAPVYLTDPQHYDVLVYDDGTIVNVPPSYLVSNPSIYGGTDISITGGNTINNTSTIQTVSGRGNTTNNNLISSSGFTVRKDASGTFAPMYYFQNSSGVNRWNFGMIGSESGGNAGSDLSITGYDDAGNSLASYLTIKRNNGWIGISSSPTSQLTVGGKITSTGLHLSLPGTSQGDLYYVNSNGDFERLGVGSNGQVLSSNGIFPVWSNASDTTSGTVTSVALDLPSIFSVSGSPITTSGTISASLQSQSAKTVFAAPNASSGTPSFRTLVASDIPNLAASQITSGVLNTARLGSGTASSSTYLRGDGTWAAVAGGSQDLQSVTDQDSTTDNSIIIKNGADSVHLYNNGTVIISGSMIAAGGGYNSDARLKNIIGHNLPHIIQNLDPVIYKWKPGMGDKKVHVGYIAQEVEKFMPDAVVQRPDGYKALDYTEIHTAAINDLYSIIKQQQSQIDELKKQIQLLKNK